MPNPAVPPKKGVGVKQIMPDYVDELRLQFNRLNAVDRVFQEMLNGESSVVEDIVPSIKLALIAVRTAKNDLHTLVAFELAAEFLGGE